MRLRKSYVAIEVKTLDEPGVYESYVSVFGNIDDGGDRVVKGAFLDDLKENPNPPVVWSHQWSVPPIGENLKTMETNEGLYTKNRLFIAKDEDHPIARQVYAGLKSGALREFSFAYEVMDGGSRIVNVEGKNIRELVKLAIFEQGPTLVGMNRQTRLLEVASGLQALRDPSAEPLDGAALLKMMAQLSNVDLETLIADYTAEQAEKSVEPVPQPNKKERIVVGNKSLVVEPVAGSYEERQEDILEALWDEWPAAWWIELDATFDDHVVYTVYADWNDYDGESYQRAYTVDEASEEDVTLAEASPVEIVAVVQPKAGSHRTFKEAPEPEQTARKALEESLRPKTIDRARAVELLSKTRNAERVA